MKACRTTFMTACQKRLATTYSDARSFSETTTMALAVRHCLPAFRALDDPEWLRRVLFPGYRRNSI